MPKQQPRLVPRSLAEEQGELTRARIRRAAREIVARHGFDATVEEIAQVSGVSRRTIFRHYESQSVLIATTVKDMLEVTFESLESVPSPDDDFDGWLEGVAAAIHIRSAEVIGRAFWDLQDPKHAESDIIAEVVALQHEFRVSGVRYLVTTAWQAAGGSGEPPEAVELAFALNFSTFATQSLMADFNQSPAQMGALTAGILRLLLRSAIDEQRAAAGGNPPGVDLSKH